MANGLSQYEKETTRAVTMLGVKTRVRKIPPSGEAIKGLGERTRREIIGHMAINPPEIERTIVRLKAGILREMAVMASLDRDRFIEEGPIDFVKDKGDRVKYWILCARCGDRVAYVWASDENLSDWCDLHYVCWYNKDSWRGALAINISPVDGKLGIECACGEDTRDFRMAKGMPPIQKQLSSEYSLAHRDFGLPTSKFIAVEA